MLAASIIFCVGRAEEVMQRLFKVFVMACFFAGAVMPPAALAHGGGCRKNSPPGQCCHMETRTGIVHCH
jgi:hypothetical protein